MLIQYLAIGVFVLTTALESVSAGGVEPSDKVARIGFVDPITLSPRPQIDAFWKRLRELGWVEGQNLAVEARSAEGHYDRLPSIITEVVNRKVDVLVTYSTAAGIAARKVTSSVPIVDAAIGDPVREGLAVSLAHPGGNLTGLSFGWTEGFAGKFIELLQDTVPHLSTVVMITNPNNPFERAEVKELRTTAEGRGLRLITLPLSEREALPRVLQQARQQGQALLVLGDPFLHSYRRDIASFANQNRLPALYGMRDFVEAGGMMAYGPNTSIAWRRAAEYVDKILKGAKAAELPIEQPTEYSLIVNMRSAKAVGVRIPDAVLLRADEVLR